ncbi:hypothetical protein F66182_9523, partial [Fusarium sp. NRRL 66182]
FSNHPFPESILATQSVKIMSTAQTREDIKSRLSDVMRIIAAKQQESGALLDRITLLEADLRNSISDSASSARRRRGLPDPLPIERQLQQLQQERIEKDAEIGQLWTKIHDLQQEERSLE